MVIGGRFMIRTMMNEIEPCNEGVGVPEGSLGRRRSKDWILHTTAATTTTTSAVTASRNGERSDNINVGSMATMQTITSTLSSGATSNSNRTTQFRELVEMLIYCYLECGGTQRSDQFRNLVEVFLCPLFEPVNRTAVATSSSIPEVTSLPPMSGGVIAVATPNPLIGSTTLRSCPNISSCNNNGSTGNCSRTSTLPVSVTISPSPPTATMVVTSGGASTMGVVGHCLSKNENGSCNSGGDNSLLCPVCYGIYIEPVTIQCGHSYCKKCMQKEVAGHSCCRCSYFLTDIEAAQCKTNVLLGELVEKWWPDHVTVTRLRNEGNKMFGEQRLDNAIEKYTQALGLGPEDHISLANRSNCLLTAGRSEEALQDAEAAIKSCPIWSKGYFRKSTALISLGRYEDAFLSLTVCMYLMKLNPNNKPCPPPSSSSSLPPEEPARTQVINEMIKVLQKMFIQATNATVGSTLKRHNLGGEHIQYTPYPGVRRRCNSGFNRQDWNDSFNSSRDENDHVLRSHNQQQNTRKSNKMYNQHNHHRDISVQRSSPPSSGVEQLSLRLSRLITRAVQDLKSVEVRLRGVGVSSQGMKPVLRVQPPREVSCNDVECSLCYRLLFQPVSTECGHTFCRSCLDRCMDHSPACPLCKTGLQSYLACRKHAVTQFLEGAIKVFLPNEYDERLKQHLEELNSVAHTEGKDVDVDVPIFVCTMAFPTIPCPLHVFEPRYRLMIRRCMENGSNRFGMCCYFSEGENNYGEIGTLLEIRNIQFFSDGRSVVDTLGCRRFKVLHKNVVDGYNTARIELLHDKAVLEAEVSEVHQLHDKVLQEATGWLQSIGLVRLHRIHSHFGSMPNPEEDWVGSPDGPSWTWWLLAILPLDSKAQLAILSMCSLQKRLECILKVLTFVKNRMGPIGE